MSFSKAFFPGLGSHLHDVQSKCILTFRCLKPSNKKVCQYPVILWRRLHSSTTTSQYLAYKWPTSLQKTGLLAMKLDYQTTTTRGYYDPSLFGLDSRLDQAVAQHQRQAMLYARERALKDGQAMQVAPGVMQSPIAIMNMNPTYRLTNEPLALEYPTTVRNVRLKNTGFSWEVKIPYQIAINTALHGAHLNQAQYYRLDHFHCHWGSSETGGSEHIIDGHSYSAELHFVHYNMEKYHSLAKAARHPDGLAVLAVFLDADGQQRKHAELEKVVSQLKLVSQKGDHAIIKQPLRLNNLLPLNKSYWSYQGSLTTPPYLESVTWFILKQPVKCSITQIENFRSISTDSSQDSGSKFIISNHRQTQPLNGRIVVTYDEPHKGYY